MLHRNNWMGSETTFGKRKYESRRGGSTKETEYPR